jgi:hypothetical protein
VEGLGNTVLKWKAWAYDFPCLHAEVGESPQSTFMIPSATAPVKRLYKMASTLKNKGGSFLQVQKKTEQKV